MQGFGVPNFSFVFVGKHFGASLLQSLSPADKINSTEKKEEHFMKTVGIYIRFATKEQFEESETKESQLKEDENENSNNLR